MCARRQRRLLFCLFVADRAWVLLAVRPSIHKAIPSLIDGDPLNYRLKQERRLQKTTLVKVSYEPLTFQHCVCVHEEKKRMSGRSQMHFSLFLFPFSFGCLFFGQTLSGLAIILGRYQCVAASSDQACDKG